MTGRSKVQLLRHVLNRTGPIPRSQGELSLTWYSTASAESKALGWASSLSEDDDGGSSGRKITPWACRLRYQKLDTNRSRAGPMSSMDTVRATLGGLATGVKCQAVYDRYN